jgi:hypothetical protein
MEDGPRVVSYNSATELVYGDTNNESNYPKHNEHGEAVRRELERNRQAQARREEEERYAQRLGAGKSKKKRSTKRTTKKKPKHTLKRKPKRKPKRKTNKK